MTGTPLWLCLKIQPTKERKAHQAFNAHGLVSLYAHKIVRLRRSSRARVTIQIERPLLTGYAMVAHDGLPCFVERLHQTMWLGTDIPIVKDVLGRVPLADVTNLQRMTGLTDEQIAKQLGIGPRLLQKDDQAKFLAGPLQGSTVRVTVVNGNKVRVEVAGREVSTTMDKLEAA